MCESRRFLSARVGNPTYKFHCVTGTNFTFGNHLRHPAAVAFDDLLEILVPLAEVTAGDAHSGDFDRARLADAQLVADAHRVQVDPARGEVLTDAAVLQIDPVFRAQPAVQL